MLRGGKIRIIHAESQTREDIKIWLEDQQKKQ